MNGIGMALLLIVLATVAMSVWAVLHRSHRISGSTDLDKMGEALAGARDAQQRLADSETPDSVPWQQRGQDDQERT